jgi:hypothetical protein
MNILKVLHREEKKLLHVAGKIEKQVNQIRAAINALGTNGLRSHPLKGRKISAAHRAAIKRGIAKRKAARARADR